MEDCKVISPRKGFTIVEVVIVIAVIAILAAVAVPAFSGVVDKAKISVVSQLAANFNKAVATCEAADESILTMHDVICTLEEFGFDESDAIDDKGDYCVVWDSEQNRFVVFDKDEKKVCSEEERSTPLTKLWQVVDEIPAEADTSLYLAESIDIDTVSVEVGVDVGDNEEIKEIIYTDTDDDIKDIIIRINDPATEVDLTNKGNDNVTVIGLNNSPESVTPPTNEAPGNTDDPESTDAPESTDEPIEDDKSYLIPESEDKIVYSVVTNKQYNSLENAATIGGELILIANVKEASIEVKNDVILDLNGFTVGYFDSETGENNKDTMIINGGNLIVKDSSVNQLGNIANVANAEAKTFAVRVIAGTFTLNSGTVKGMRSGISCEGGVVNINGGTVEGVGTAAVSAIYLGNNSNVIINDGYITTEGRSNYVINTKDTAIGYDVTINGGLIEGTIGHIGTGKITINKGTIIGIDAAVLMKKGTLEINGGAISTQSTASKNSGYVPAASVETYERVGAAIHIDAMDKKTGNKAYITITGGNLSSKNFHTICITGDINGGTNNGVSLDIKGGTFISKEGYQTVLSSNSVIVRRNIKVEGVTYLQN